MKTKSFNISTSSSSSKKLKNPPRDTPLSFNQTSETRFDTDIVLEPAINRPKIRATENFENKICLKEDDTLRER